MLQSGQPSRPRNRALKTGKQAWWVVRFWSMYSASEGMKNAREASRISRVRLVSAAA